MATASKNPNLQKTSSSTKLAKTLNALVERKFSQMSDEERAVKHKEFTAALKGRKP